MSKATQFLKKNVNEAKAFPVSYTVKFKVDAPDKEMAENYGKAFIKAACATMVDQGFDWEGYEDLDINIVSGSNYLTVD
jgi:hypothetical protein